MADTYDITSLLKKGNNDIFIIAHFIGETVKYNRVDRPGIIATIKGTCTDKKTFTSYTDDSWQVYAMKCWNNDTPRKNWAIGFIEDLNLNYPSYAVLEAYATEDYGDFLNKPSVTKFANLAKKPRCYKIDNLTVRERIVPYLIWSKEPPLVLKEIYRNNPEIYLLADSIRLDNEYLEPENDNEKYNIQKNVSVELNRNIGEKGYILLYDMGRMTAGEITVEIQCESRCIVDVQYTESIRNGRQYGSRVGSVTTADFTLKKA